MSRTWTNLITETNDVGLALGALGWDADSLIAYAGLLAPQAGADSAVLAAAVLDGHQLKVQARVQMLTPKASAAGKRERAHRKTTARLWLWGRCPAWHQAENSPRWAGLGLGRCGRKRLAVGFGGRDVGCTWVVICSRWALAVAMSAARG